MIFGNIIGGVSGVSSALNAYNNKKATKYIARENRKIAEMQFEYNKKEISRAFRTNLKSILREQSNERAEAIKEADEILSQINMSTGNNANVDSESFEHDIKDKTSKDIADNMAVMLDTHKLSLDELINTKVAQTYNLGLNYENVISNINNREIALKNKYTEDMANGIIKAFTGFEKAYTNTKGSGDTTEDTESENSSGSDSLFKKAVKNFNFNLG